MKILWISTMMVGFSDTKPNHSWQWTLLEAIRQQPNVEIAITSVVNSKEKKIIKNKVHYFPIFNELPSNKILRKIAQLSVETRRKLEAKYCAKILDIIDQYRPDLIHMWGMEHYYISLIKATKVPVVVHTQGIACTCQQAILPPSISENDLRGFDSLLDDLRGTALINGIKAIREKADRERQEAKHIQYVMGRTAFDKEVLSVIAPQARYFHCDEIMRDDFQSAQWQYKSAQSKIRLSTTISPIFYKGLDVVFTTAEVLQATQQKSIEWNVLGIDQGSRFVRFFEKKYKKSAKSLGIHFCGNVDAERLSAELLHSDIYIHTSYIENSSNAISEAQLLGVPVIAQYVGGLSTICQNGAGLLVSANDPYSLAYHICHVKENEFIAQNLSIKGFELAHKRHDKNQIVKTLLDIYHTILQDKSE